MISPNSNLEESLGFTIFLHSEQITVAPHCIANFYDTAFPRWYRLSFEREVVRGHRGLCFDRSMGFVVARTVG